MHGLPLCCACGLCFMSAACRPGPASRRADRGRLRRHSRPLGCSCTRAHGSGIPSTVTDRPELSASRYATRAELQEPPQMPRQEPGARDTPPETQQRDTRGSTVSRRSAGLDGWVRDGACEADGLDGALDIGLRETLLGLEARRVERDLIRSHGVINRPTCAHGGSERERA